ncbi:helix-turn-helix domain-containing protein [Amycolatopsis rubida]|uniref:Helix-turn-helix domain-containing protein n=1 Tax=Amycolatopsis rubida TaxID=112413 RepID=A0A1I5VKM5_9PSEU|nr:helix-turn-helix domain-containing protein [Amycolatopsis rubida]NEC58774.1 helix-turn-helix domain-containing protein [Amycolatopsis rubida]OAP22972.1 HTH-type transcriptional activator RhaS [Amycolatopsis sp. M39]SFQ07981.1 Helix-turn-helix domain-containing protein [Amycolatopsis rubida]
MYDLPDFDLAPYEADFGESAPVRRSYCSWTDAGWRSLLVQCFDHETEVEELSLPGVADVHLVLCVAGEVLMWTRVGGGTVRRRWNPGTMELLLPGQPVVRGYRASGPMRTIQVHIPSGTVARVVAELGGPPPDFEAVADRVSKGDPVAEHLVRALPAASSANEVYAESAATFLATHLLARGDRLRPPGREHPAVRAATAVMQDRLAEPLTLAEIAEEAHLSVYHLIRVFRAATGETPHRYLTRLRIERARRLLRDSTLTIAQIAERSGFGSPGSLSTAFLGQIGVRPSEYRNS